jgi:hypothetical protein
VTRWAKSGFTRAFGAKGAVASALHWLGASAVLIMLQIPVVEV